MTDSDPPSNLVAEVWAAAARAKQADLRRGWLDSSIVVWDYVQPLVSGERRRSWLVEAAARIQAPPDGLWASLGCGAGGTEIWAAERGLFSHLRGFDISAGAIEIARRAAEEAGLAQRLDFAIIDMERPELPARQFDVALFAMALHHVSDLEACLAAVARSLKPGGGLIINEYIGPARQQFSQMQLDIVGQLLKTLPPRLRTLRDGTLKTAPFTRSVDEWIAADPSEAVRSSEIPAAIADVFDVVFRKDYGGTILGPLLEDIIHNFEQEREDDVGFIKTLGSFEQQLIRHGVLASDFTVMAARKRR